MAAESHSLFRCPKCNVESVDISITPGYPWCRTARCTGVLRHVHRAPWFVCVQCPSYKIRTAMKRPAVLEKHRSRHHSSSPDILAPTSQPTNFSNSVSNAVEFPETTEANHESEYASDAMLQSLLEDVMCIAPAINFHMLFQNRLEIPPHIGELNYKSVRSQTHKNVSYFEREHNRVGLGAAGLVALAGHGTISNASEITPQDTLFGLANSWFFNSLKPKQRLVYTALLHRIDCESTTTSVSSDRCLSPSHLIVPKNLKEGDRYFISGANSIRENVARPSVHSIRSGFAYVSFCESLACMLGSQARVEPLVGNGHPYLDGRESLQLHRNACTPRGREIQQAGFDLYGREAFGPNQPIPTLILPVVLWSDGCEPANTKQNRGSVQVYLASVGFEENDAHCGRTTFLLALGPHSADTNDVEELFIQELTTLSQSSAPNDNLYYYGSAKRVVRIYCEIYSILQDRIERQAHSRILAGNSNHTARWGWIGILGSVVNILPSCRRCYEGLLMNEDTSHVRNADNCCANWNMDGLTYPPPKDYPLDEITTVPKSLSFRKCTYEGMGLACDTCFLKVSSGAWSSNCAKIYMNSEGVNPAYALTVVSAGLNSFTMSKAPPESAQFRELLRRSLLLNTNFPVTQPEKPWTWRLPNTSLLESIDVIMHLLFLGIVATIIREAYFRWLRAKLVMTSFAKVTKVPLKRVEDLHLVWCKVQPISVSGTLSNHVSENFLAFARLGKWLFGCSGILRPDDQRYADPEIRPDQYKIGQIRRWYKERGLVMERGLDHAEIKANFLTLMNRQGGPPPIPEKGEAGIEEDIVHGLIEATVAMVAHVMIDGDVSDTDCENVERHVKLFLGAFEKFDKPRRDMKDAQQSVQSAPKQKATWIAKMNFISLLNLPDVMHRFGSLRALWEGDKKGEGGLPKVKAKVKGGTKGNWSRTAAVAMLCDNAVEQVLQAAEDGVVDSSMDSSVQQLLEASQKVTGNAGSSKYKNFVGYNNREEVDEALNSGTPLSLVYLADKTCGVFLKNTLSFISIVLDEEVEPKVICGATYLRFRSGNIRQLAVSEELGNLQNGQQQDSVASKYAILLPELTRDNNNESKLHYLITSEWEEMVAGGAIVRYQLSAAKYQ